MHNSLILITTLAPVDSVWFTVVVGPWLNYVSHGPISCTIDQKIPTGKLSGFCMLTSQEDCIWAGTCERWHM
jgi:hypothetical protein